MSTSKLKSGVPPGFDNPIALPSTPAEELAWQEANREWWEQHPMRYDFSEKLEVAEFSKQFYEEIDKRFFADAATMMSWRKLPFDSLIDFDSLNKKDVLEIGCGNGSHAQLLAKHARTYTGIDLTSYAIKSTTQRLNQLGLNGTVTRMDAEHMNFPDEAFDYVWSWGVIHHSANTRQIIKQIHGVLRPGGEAQIMVYHRNFWTYRVFAGLMAGIGHGHLLRTKSFHEASQLMTDGAIARFYRADEWKTLVSDLFEVRDIRILGSKTGLVPFPPGRMKKGLMALIPNGVSRFLNNQMKFGNFLFSTLRKNQ
jgi:2-polyprenyl-3-methyl-5-hydroxy-6-metoxy-1,4-benzoquinol methylase